MKRKAESPSATEPKPTSPPPFGSLSNSRRCDYGIVIYQGRIFELDRGDNPTREIPSSHGIRIVPEFVQGQGTVGVYDTPPLSEIDESRRLHAQRERNLALRNLQSEKDSALQQIAANHQKVRADDDFLKDELERLDARIRENWRR